MNTVEQWTERAERTFDRIEAGGQTVDRAWCLEWIRQHVEIVPGDPHYPSPEIAACNAFQAHRNMAGRLYVARYGDGSYY